MKRDKLIKSRSRVERFAEVYTPKHIVRDMCGLIPERLWNDIDSTFLEPACGNGNFLAEIYERKLKLCSSSADALRALHSIYGIDIQADNIEESRQRLFDMFIKAFPNAALRDIVVAEMVLRNNIICGNSLEIMKKWEEKSND